MRSSRQSGDDRLSISATRPGLLHPRLDGLARAFYGLRGWRRNSVSFALGAFSILGYAPFHLWPLLFLILPCFIWLMDGIAGQANPREKPQWRQAAILGWWFGFGFFMAGLYWLGFAFFVEADKFAWLAPLGVAVLPAGLAIFFAMASTASIALWRPGASRIFAFTATFFSADWLRGHILTGFPWNLWGYALGGDAALSQAASLVGIYGMTLLALLAFASPAALAGMTARMDARNWLLPAILAGIIVAGWGWGTLRLIDATNDVLPSVRLRVVQASIPQAEKWKPENRDWIFERYQTLSREPGQIGADKERPTHIIWPETSIPYLFMLNDRILFDEVRKALSALLTSETTLILGGERVEGTKREDGRYDIERVFNSLFLIGADGSVLDTYDKNHLVPFGEYIPFEKTLSAIGVKQLTHMNTGFDRGSLRRPMAAPGAPSFVPLICYEAIFPQRVVGDGERPGWLLNVTNDAWFGVSSGPYQHLHQSRIRAVEQGLPVIRAANTGVSAIIDAHGRIVASLPLGQIGIMDRALPVAIEPTLYARWGGNGLMVLAILIFLLYRIVIEVE